MLRHFAQELELLKDRINIMESGFKKFPEDVSSNIACNEFFKEIDIDEWWRMIEDET